MWGSAKFFDPKFFREALFNALIIKVLKMRKN